MSTIIKISPEYSSFYIAGNTSVDVPFDFQERLIPHTPDCISVPCLNRDDGNTTVTIGRFSDMAELEIPAFDGRLDTPDRVFVLFDAITPQFARIEVENVATRLRIWLNDLVEPTLVIIAWE